ncbi:MAG: hypothetical protein ACYSVY_28830, partial [Planctomycetota bacterium]
MKLVIKSKRSREGHRTHGRGTVLILVVALLGLLFVAGAAFLGTVAFESRSISSRQDVREDLAVVDAVEAEIFRQLNRAWLGANATPYDNDSTQSAIVGVGVGARWKPSTLVDAYGEVPGQHPLIAPIEPFDPDPTATGNVWLYSGSSDLELARRGIPWNDEERVRNESFDDYLLYPPGTP